MKIFILSGAIGEKSCTRTLLKYLEDVLIDRDIETVFWDLAERPLPIAIPEYHQRQAEHPDKVVREFAEAVTAADAFLLGSPLYHDSFSGVLKNALDNLPHEAFLRKPVGLVSHSSNTRSCVTPCNHLRPVVRSLGGYSTQSQIGTTDDDYNQLNGRLAVTSDKIKQRVEKLVDELLVLSTLPEHKSVPGW